MGDTPAAHDFRHPEPQTETRLPMPKTKRRSHRGSGAVPTVEAEPPEKFDSRPAKKPISVPTVEAENLIVRSHSGSTCKLPCRDPAPAALVGPLFSVPGPLSVNLPKAESKTAVLPETAGEPDSPPKFEREHHDEHVRTMRRWVTEGKSPPGLGARLRHWREAVSGWTRERLATEAGIPVATLAAMEAGRQHVSPDAYSKIVEALAVDQLTIANVRESFDKARRAAAIPMPKGSPRLKPPPGNRQARARWLRERLDGGAFTAAEAGEAIGLTPADIQELAGGRDTLADTAWRKLAGLERTDDAAQLESTENEPRPPTPVRWPSSWASRRNPRSASCSAPSCWPNSRSWSGRP
jgi:transcriptional regulator with XRE-family HTH domain